MIYGEVVERERERERAIYGEGKETGSEIKERDSKSESESEREREREREREHFPIGMVAVLTFYEIMTNLYLMSSDMFTDTAVGVLSNHTPPLSFKTVPINML